jgi:carotenoid cleavage dioxygenase-like enzyme
MESADEVQAMSITAMTTPAPTGLHLAVEGTLPAALTGSFLQVNPHPAGGVERPPMICGIRFAGGRAELYRGDCGLTAGPAPLEATTGRYRVVVELPVVPDRAAALLGSPDRVVWQPNRPTRIGLLPAGGAAHWFDLDPCPITRIVNAYDDGDRVVVDAVRDNRVCRWELDPATGTARARWLTGPVGLTTVDDQRNIFATGVTEDGSVIVSRHDLSTWHTTERALGHDLQVSAPAYAPSGWLLVLVADPVHRRATLLVLAAGDLAIRALVHVPVAMPASDRVCWVP